MTQVDTNAHTHIQKHRDTFRTHSTHIHICTHACSHTESHLPDPNKSGHGPKGLIFQMLHHTSRINNNNQSQARRTWLVTRTPLALGLYGGSVLLRDLRRMGVRVISTFGSACVMAKNATMYSRAYV
jgi:hypothetical protein